jgi:hypothetical protein
MHKNRSRDNSLVKTVKENKIYKQRCVYYLLCTLRPKILKKLALYSIMKNKIGKNSATFLEFPLNIWKENIL